MKNFGTFLAALCVAAVLILYMCTFQVRFTEVAIVKTWGRPAKDAVTEPGLKFKLPPPVQTVVVYDKRVRIQENRTEETRTVDGKNLVVSAYTLWRVADPAKFLTNFPEGVEDGEKRLRTAVVAHQLAVIGQRRFDEFISTDPASRKVNEIEKQVFDAVAADVRSAYGIEVVGYGFKKLGLPESVTTAIFESMKSHESGNAARYQAEGNATANDILANAKAAKERILAAARQEVADIEAEAQRVVSDYYKEFDRRPDLRIFLDKLRTVAQALRERTTLIITTEESPFDVFDEEARKNIPVSSTPTSGAGESRPRANARNTD